MAAWQYDLFLVPRRAVLDQNALPKPRLSPAELHSDACWRAGEPPAGYEARVAEALAESESWSRNLRCWGHEDGDRIEVWARDGRMGEVRARVDARHPPGPFLGWLAGFAQDFGLVLVTPEGRVLEPGLEALTRAFERSAAYAYACDPRGYLAQIRASRRADLAEDGEQ